MRDQLHILMALMQTSCRVLYKPLSKPLLKEMKGSISCQRVKLLLGVCGMVADLKSSIAEVDDFVTEPSLW